MEDPSSVSVSDAAEKTPVLSRLKLVSNLRGDLLINVAFSERSELGGLLESRALMAITEELAGAGQRLFLRAARHFYGDRGDESCGCWIHWEGGWKSGHQKASISVANYMFIKKTESRPQ